MTLCCRRTRCRMRSGRRLGLRGGFGMKCRATIMPERVIRSLQCCRMRWAAGMACRSTLISASRGASFRCGQWLRRTWRWTFSQGRGRRIIQIAWASAGTRSIFIAVTGRTFVSQSKPYEIPLGSLIARDVDNLMAVGKSMGTTHITNGAYRQHPTEWAAGEAAGATLAWALEHKVDPAGIGRDPAQMEKLQRSLVQRGHPVFWYDDIPVAAPAFAAMQMAGARQWVRTDNMTLHADENAALKGSEAAAALKGAMPARDTSAIAGVGQMTWSDLSALGYDTGRRAGPVRRGEFAKWMLERMR